MTKLDLIPLTALMLSGILGSGWNLLSPLPMDEPTLAATVGAVYGKCCRAGRRWGCDPANFRQSGCTDIEGSQLNCVQRKWATMRCGSSACVPSNPEHVCEVDVRMVKLNRCRPTGEGTTANCPEDQWQCEIEMRRYTETGNPEKEAIVCDADITTLCSIDYSACD